MGGGADKGRVGVEGGDKEVKEVKTVMIDRMIDSISEVWQKHLVNAYEGFYQQQEGIKQMAKEVTATKSKSTWLKGAKYKREIYKGGDGMFYVRVKARNGNIVNTMAEGYQRGKKAEQEFDKLHSVDDIQTAKNAIEQTLINFRSNPVYALVTAQEALDVLNKVWGKIDRRKE